LSRPSHFSEVIEPEGTHLLVPMHRVRPGPQLPLQGVSSPMQASAHLRPTSQRKPQVVPSQVGVPPSGALQGASQVVPQDSGLMSLLHASPHR
jgi:hypothetical protein